ncbi:MAG: ATP-binding cassette domain-containing protein [Clostridiales bacterium]|nr:ATP-binding cassette domain-containing protein [Clostridiales bacterium]
MIEVKNLYLKYIREYFALYNINLKVEKGECVAFVGNEHSGRTTLLRVISGLEKFDSGEVFINGRDLKTIDFSTDYELGYIPVVPVFFDNKTVYQNLQYVLKARKFSQTEIEAKINKVLIDFKIEKYKNIKAKDLDLYEKYLISFVRLALREIDILLVDNIFEKLTPEESQSFIELIKYVFLSKNTTTIIAGDNFEQLQAICSRKINLISGSIEEEK